MIMVIQLMRIIVMMVALACTSMSNAMSDTEIPVSIEGMEPLPVQNGLCYTNPGLVEERIEQNTNLPPSPPSNTDVREAIRGCIDHNRIINVLLTVPRKVLHCLFNEVPEEDNK